MTKRERKWLKARQQERGRRRFYREARKRIWRTFFDVNMAATKVFINEAGNVEVKILTTEELLDLKVKMDAGELMPDDTTFTTI
jgi:hypothetical protein